MLHSKIGYFNYLDGKTPQQFSKLVQFEIHLIICIALLSLYKDFVNIVDTED